MPGTPNTPAKSAAELRNVLIALAILIGVAAVVVIVGLLT